MKANKKDKWLSIELLCNSCSIVLIFLFLVSCSNKNSTASNLYTDSRFIAYESTSKDEIRFHLKNSEGEFLRNFERLNEEISVEGKTVKFAFNGGMYKKNRTPQGLYVENGIKVVNLDTLSAGYGNFYLSPNGVFYLESDGSKHVVETSKFNMSDKIIYATQSGPMLVIDDQIHSKFREGSTNLNIRNGVGVLPNGEVLFVISNVKVNLYDFANYFKMNGCKNALYLDGFVSKLYYPPNHNQIGGDFGVIISVLSN